MSASVSSLHPSPEGTCVQIEEASPLWAVRGREDWYRCDAERGTCNCLDWMHRQARTVTPCRHLRMLESYLLNAGIVRARFTAPPAEERPPLPGDEELRRIFA